LKYAWGVNGKDGKVVGPGCPHYISIARAIHSDTITKIIIIAAEVGGVDKGVLGI
jgi:hypothetical protein